MVFQEGQGTTSERVQGMRASWECAQARSEAGAIKGKRLGKDRSGGDQVLGGEAGMGMRMWLWGIGEVVIPCRSQEGFITWWVACTIESTTVDAWV